MSSKLPKSWFFPKVTETATPNTHLQDVKAVASLRTTGKGKGEQQTFHQLNSLEGPTEEVLPQLQILGKVPESWF